ncbi:MAG: FecR domain-containing protein [Pseudomonadota bacterium]
MPIAAEAAVWISRLHGPHRSAQMERECLEWQAQSEAHRRAFEHCTATWEDVRGVSLSTAFAALPATPPSASPWIAISRWPRWASALSLAAMSFAVITIVALGVLFWGHDAFSTDVGEQRVVVLEDGSRVSLNTDSRVRVELAAAVRTVTLERGEALFEVAKDVKRPFMVRVAGSEVLAIGTVFAVRRTHDALAVTLIEGQVAVRPVATEAGRTPGSQVMMRPGERLSLGRPGGPASVDTPRIEQVTAWRRGEAAFDDVSLGDAVAEMNRYNRIPIVLADDMLAARRVSGVFRTGDNLAFAQAVAALHGLTVKEQGKRLELAQQREPPRSIPR